MNFDRNFVERVSEAAGEDCSRRRSEYFVLCVQGLVEARLGEAVEEEAVRASVPAAIDEVVALWRQVVARERI